MKTDSGASGFSGRKLRPRDNSDLPFGARNGSLGLETPCPASGYHVTSTDRSSFQPTGSNFVRERVVDNFSRVVTQDGSTAGSVQQQFHEATLPDDKGRVCPRARQLPDSSFHQDDDSARSTGDGSRESSSFGPDPRSQGSQRYHGDHQKGEARRATGDVSDTRDQHRDEGQRQDHRGGDEDSSSHVGSESRDCGDGSRVRDTSRSDLRGGFESIPQVRGMGQTGGASKSREWMASSSVRELGGTHGDEWRTSCGHRSIDQQGVQDRDSGSYEQDSGEQPEGHGISQHGKCGQFQDREDHHIYSGADAGDDDPHAGDAGRARRVEGSFSQEAKQPVGSQFRTSSVLEDSPAESKSDHKTTHVLPAQKSRALEQASQQILSNSLASVSDANRLFLLEVACGPDSVLSQEAIDKHGKSAMRCSIWNGFDLTTGEGVKGVLKVLKQRRPRYVWIATECGPFSPIQNCNQRNEEQKRELIRKQHEARKQHVGGLVVAYMANKLGSVVCWEWSRRCRAWKWDMIDEWRNKCQTTTAIIGGCQVGLVDPKSGKPLGKEWRVEVTNQRLANLIHSPCSCKGPGVHALCEGSLTRNTAFYTKTFARKVLYHMVHLENNHTIGVAFHDHEGSREHDHFSPNHPKEKFDSCWCRDVKKWNQDLICLGCSEKPKDLAFVGEEADQEEGGDEPPAVVNQGDQELTEEEKKRINRHLNLIHSSTGHGAYSSLINALKRRGVQPNVLRLAQDFRCSACEEHKRPDARRRATLEVHTDRWKSVQLDAAFWRHPVTKKHMQIIVMLDEASRFLVAKVGNTEKKGVTASEYIEMFETRWKPYFGMPDIVRTDPEGGWRSKEMSEYMQSNGINFDTIPAEAHWNLTHVERSIQWLKEFLSKSAQDTEGQSFQELLSHAVYVWNQREVVRGYSPFQHALGRLPDLEGRFFENRVHDLPLEMMQSPDGEVELASRIRNMAEKAFVDWQLQEKLTRARNSRHHVIPEFHPGDLVFYWRTQISGAESHSWNRGKYVGPARILALETKREADQRIKAGSVVWLVKGSRLIKVAVEQLRHASVREANLHELQRPPNMPWTFTELASDLSHRVFDEHTGQGPPPAKRALVEPREEGEHPTARRRFHEKLPPVTTREVVGEQDEDIPLPGLEEEVEGESLDEVAQRRPRRVERSRSPTRGATTMFTGATWQQGVAESFWVTQDNNFWNEERATVEVQLSMPTQERQWKKFHKDPQQFFVSALKRRTIEVSERRMTQSEHEQFKGAKQAEVDKFIAAEALQALPPHLQPSKSQALRMRWVLTWKKVEDGVKPKARAVVLGYLDPDYANRPTFAPTMTRHSRQLLLQWAANKQAHVWKGDVSAAFLQGRTYDRDLFLIPTNEICAAMKLPPESIVKMRKACYGLVEAPIEWFETMNTHLKSLGFHQLLSDPCSWKLCENGQTIALISGHVDDFLFTGLERNVKWQLARKSILEKFKWQPWEQDDFVQCGVRVKKTQQGFELDQVRYLEEIQPISVSKERRKEVKEETTDHEKTELRGLLGALSWHTSQVAFRFAAYTSLALSDVSKSTVQELLDANGLLQKMKAAVKEPLKIFGFQDREVPQVYCWCDASSQNRNDGSSTKGIFIGMSGEKLLKGEVDAISPWFWQSGKIDRICRSPGSAEARAAIDAEDALYLLRYQWSEIQGHTPDVHSPDLHVKRAVGVLITDSRNVYDHLERPYITPKGAQRRVDLELLTLKESQNCTGLCVRWVNSQAMLANSLTKRGEDFQMTKFVQLNQVWKIVNDDMFSGKKRIQMGKQVFDA